MVQKPTSFSFADLALVDRLQPSMLHYFEGYVAHCTVLGRVTPVGPDDLLKEGKGAHDFDRVRPNVPNELISYDLKQTRVVARVIDEVVPLIRVKEESIHVDLTLFVASQAQHRGGPPVQLCGDVWVPRLGEPHRTARVLAGSVVLFENSAEVGTIILAGMTPTAPNAAAAPTGT